MKNPIIAVTGINAIDNPGPGTGVARSLRENNELAAQIIGLAYDVMEPGLYMDWLFDRRYIMPYPSSEPDLLLARLEHIQSQFGLDFIIPNFDVELPLYIQCAAKLEAIGIKTYLPTKSQFALRNKAKLSEVVAAFGGVTPRTIVITSLDDLPEATKELGYPLMIKGPYYKAYCVHTESELKQRFYELTAEWGYPIILQEIVTGSELNLVGVGDGKGGHLGLVAIKKMGITALGKVWSAMTIHNPGLLAMAEAFLQHSQWRGAFELECIVDRDGQIYLIEINPRFPAWIYFPTAVGVNLPARMVQAALGLPLPPLPTYEAGKLLMRYTYEIVTDSTPLQTLVTLGER